MSEGGFTLVELAVVLAIAAVVASLVVVRVEGWSSRQELHGAARALGNTIRSWRERAEEEERPFILSLWLEDGTYAVEDPSLRGPGEEPGSVAQGKLGAGRGFGKVILGEVELRSPVRILFDPRGVAPDLRIPIENAHREQVVVRMHPLVNEVEYEMPKD